MKKFLTITMVAAVIFISGCSLTPSRYDTNEYASLVRVEVMAREGKEICSDSNAVRSHLDKMKRESEFLFTFTRYLPNNSLTHQIAFELRANIIKMNTRYQATDPSVAYCKGKFLIMTKQAQRALESVGAKVR